MSEKSYIVSKTASRKPLANLIALLLIALVAVAGYKLSPLLLPRADVTVHPDPGCDLRRDTCSAALAGGGKIELSLLPRPIPVVKPLKVEVTVQGPTPVRVQVDFAGVDMNMGLNRPELKPSGDGRYTGEATLPVCVTGAMSWQATVILDTGRERVAVPFRFDTGPRR